MTQILEFVQTLLDYLKEFKAADIIQLIKDFLEGNTIQPR